MLFVPRLVCINRSILQKKLAPICTSFALKQSHNLQPHKKLVPSDSSNSVSSGTIKEKVKQSVSDVWYSSVIVGGVALTGFILYIIIRELFSGKSPTHIYKEALDICTSDVRIQDLLGQPITGCGEANRRGRRTHLASQERVDNNGKKHILMRFYLKGAYATGTAHLEVYETDFGEMEYRYLVVEVEGLTRRQVILRPEETQEPASVAPRLAPFAAPLNPLDSHQ